ncbi:hypothetical protein EsH8_IV_000546 [Colletotrichum jinshuiense]
MIFTSSPLALLALAAAAAANHQPPPDDDLFCPPPLVPCAKGCIYPDQICCQDKSAATTAWSCAKSEICGPNKNRGCMDPPSPSSPSTPLPPPTSTVQSTAIPSTPGDDSNPALTISFPAGTQASTSASGGRGGDDGVVSSVARPTLTAQPPTCFFEAVLVQRNPSDAGKPREPCPTTLASPPTSFTGVVSGAGTATRAEAQGVAVLVGAVVAVVAATGFAMLPA